MGFQPTPSSLTPLAFDRRRPGQLWGPSGEVEPELNAAPLDPLDVGPQDQEGIPMSPANQRGDRPGRAYPRTLESQRGRPGVRTDDQTVEPGDRRRLIGAGLVEHEPRVTDVADEARAENLRAEQVAQDHEGPPASG